MSKAERKHFIFDDEDIDTTAQVIPAEKPGTTMSVKTMARMLGLGKTESYWLVHKNFFKTVVAAKTMRIDIESFEYWYAGQIKYKKVDGPPPGARLKEESFGADEIAELLGISQSQVYLSLKQDDVPFILVDYWKRWKKEDFYRWYENQDRYITKEDRERNKTLEEQTMSMPEMAWLLGVTRSVVYSLLREDSQVGAKLETVWYGARRRITNESFFAWYESQNKYKMVFPTIEEAKATKPKAVPANKKVKEASDGSTWSRTYRQVSANDDYYTIQEVGKLLGVSHQAVLRRIRKDGLPAIPVGKSFRIPKPEFESWYEEHKPRKGKK